MARKPKSVSVNFEGVEAGGFVLPEDEYMVEVDEVELKTSDNSGADYLLFTFKVAEGDHEGKKLFHNCSLQPQALFNLRGVLESLGLDVPDGAMELDPADLIGLQCSVSVQHEEYQGKTKARIVEFRPGEEGVVEKPISKAATKPAAKKATKEEPAEEAPPARKRRAKAPSIEVGSKVTFVDDEGEELEGKVLKIEDGEATVKVGKDEWELSIDELTLA